MAGYGIINQVALKETASAQIFEKFVQNILHVNGKGVDESYVNEAALNSQSIAIPHVALGAGSFRKLGATVNGGQFNGNAAVNPKSNYFYVPLLYVYDRTEKLAKIMNDKAGYMLLSRVTENISKKIARGINAITFAEQISKTLNDSYSSGEATYVKENTDLSAYEAFVDANALLDEGDDAIECDFFPTEMRQAFVRPSFFSAFKKGDTRYIINSDLGQEMLATGVLNPFVNSEASKVELREGYGGEIDGVPVYKVSPVLWRLAATYTISNGNSLDETAFDDIDAVLCSGVGTIRGFSSDGEVEVIPSQEGQGWVIQPLVHGGVSCISGKSVRLIVKSTFTNPVTSDETKLSVLPIESQND